MLTDVFKLVSLQAFAVSPVRKLWFAVKVLLLLVLLYFAERLVVTETLSNELALLLLVALSVNVLISMIRLWLVSMYRQRTKLPVGERDNFVMGIDASANVTMLLLVAASVFPVFGLPFAKFITSISLFSVAFAWLFKEYFTNFIDSFRLMFSKDFLTGDYIKLSDTSKGIITDITFRATKVKTDEGDVLFIPNSTLMNTEVTNYSKVKYKRISVPFSVATEKIVDLDVFERALKQRLAAEFPDTLQEEKIFLRIINLENGFTKCALEASTDTYSFAIEDAIHKAVYKAVLDYKHNND